MDKLVQILYVDDDIELSGLVQEYLESKSFKIKLLHNPEEVIPCLKEDSYHLCMMDVKMPHKDGFTLAEEINKAGISIPFLFLTGQTRKEDRIKGLRLGAEDYISKPFSLEELYLRIQVISRRAMDGDEKPINEFSLGNYIFLYDYSEIRTPEKSIHLSTTEAKVLKFLCQNMNSLVNRKDLLIDIWGEDDYHKGLSLNVYITRLRKRFEDNPSVSIINEHGHGYKLLVR